MLSDEEKQGLQDAFRGKWEEPVSDCSESVEGVSDNVLDRPVFLGKASFCGVEWDLESKKYHDNQHHIIFMSIIV